MSNKTKQLTENAMLIALTALVTLAVRIPTPTGGHVNLGDSVIFLSAIIFGSLRGAVIGGVGSAIADLIGGHYFFVPGTLIIKAAEGYITGFMSRLLKEKNPILGRTVSALAGGFVMVIGYFIYEVIFINLAVALSVIIPNTIQALVCAVLAVSLYPFISKKTKK